MGRENINMETGTKIAGKFTGWFKKYVSSDVIIIGGGPAGLMAALDLAKVELKILVIESNDHAGGSLWASDLLISASMHNERVREVLDEIKIPYKEGKGGLSVASGPNATSKLVSATCDAGVKILNMAKFNDLIYADKKVEGVIVDWSPRLSLRQGINTVVAASLKCQMVIDATGAGANVCRALIKKGIVTPKKYEKADIRASEEFLLENSGQIYPGLAVAGMAAATVYGIRQGGLTLCSMLLSGRKAAESVVMALSENFLLSRKNR